MRPIRLTTIGKIVWSIIIIIVILLAVFVISLFRKEKPNKVDDPKTNDSEKIIDYTESKNYLYDFDDESSLEDLDATITIKDSGTYKLKGRNQKYKFVIDSEDSVIKLIFSNFTTDQVDKLIEIKKANKVIIELEDNTENKIASDLLESSSSSKPIIITSNANIEFTGNGKLIVDSIGTFIKSKGNINFKNAILEINNISNGFDIEGNTKFESGTIYILAANNGFNSDGSISIESGTFVIRSAKTAIKTNGLFIINSGMVFIASGDEIQKPNANSLQKSLILNFKEPRKSLFIIHDTAQIVLAYAGGIEYSHILYSDEFKAESYVLYGNGKIAGTQTYGLYKVEDSEESAQLTCENLENDHFVVSDLVNIYDDIVKK